MTRIEIEAYQAELSNEIFNIDDRETLVAIKRIIKKAKARKATIAPPRITLPNQPLAAPRHYTVEEAKRRIADAIKSYEQGEYIINDNSKSQSLRLRIRWTKNAYNDSAELLQYAKIGYSEHVARKLASQIENIIEIINYNSKTGKKEPLLIDVVPDYDIRSIAVNKYCKLFYTEMPEAIVILTLQNSSNLIDVKWK